MTNLMPGADSQYGIAQTSESAAYDDIGGSAEKGRLLGSRLTTHDSREKETAVLPTSVDQTSGGPRQEEQEELAICIFFLAVLDCVRPQVVCPIDIRRPGEGQTATRPFSLPPAPVCSCQFFSTGGSSL